MDGRKLRGEQRRQELMTAGLSLVATEGIDAVTHRSVAKACGVSVASVTYHYPTVAELRNGIFGCAGDRALDAVSTAADSAPRPTDGPTTAEAAGEFAYRYCTASRDLTSTLLQLLSAAGRDATLRPVADRLNRSAENILASAVGEEDAPLVVAAIQGILLRALSLGDAGPDWARVTTRTLIATFTHDERKTS